MKLSGIDRVIDAVHKAWPEVNNSKDAEFLVRLMCEVPSISWRRYLDRSYEVFEQKKKRQVDDYELMRLECIRRHEEELYGSVADAISAQDGLVYYPS